jgi:hypothetical protein
MHAILRSVGGPIARHIDCWYRSDRGLYALDRGLYAHEQLSD